jgi:ketosteroid isomerase-like protein
MKKFIYLFIFLFVSAISAATAQSSEETKVAEAAAALNKAIIDVDKNMLVSLAADELSYGHSGEKIENKTQFIAALTSGAVDFLSIDITDQIITLAGKNAILRNKFSAKLTSDGKPVELKIGNIMVWQKVKRKWKLLARQGYKI